MKRKKLALKSVGKNDVYNNGIVRVTKEEGTYFFEIGNELTSDVAEAVALLMRKLDWNDSLWNMELEYIDMECMEFVVLYTNFQINKLMKILFIMKLKKN